VGLAIVLVVNAAIAAAYYLRIIAAMYFKTSKRGVQSDGGIAGGIAMLACLALVAIVTVRPGRLFDRAALAGAAVSGTLPAATAGSAPTADTAAR